VVLCGAVIWEYEREAYIRAQLIPAIVVTPPCAVCGTPAACIELLAPGALPRRMGPMAGYRKETSSHGDASQVSGI
jgi:hypothetical protein